MHMLHKHHVFALACQEVMLKNWNSQMPCVVITDMEILETQCAILKPLNTTMILKLHGPRLFKFTKPHIKF